ncbi:MAG TPA: DUF2235 domain-containing protein [Accumulibacter sp.]|nr:DUF2235 domain-containing protein [Accumulibacter sp.]HNL13866.1 DUF2235 domain-containing protein [Accumulibacter sp.]
MDATTTTTDPPRHLVICCDGTGNIWKPGPAKTNVAKLFAVLEKNSRQLAYYDPGVGTPDGTVSDSDGGIFSLDTWRRLGGLAWGHGVWRNVAEGYTFLLRNYRPGDRIFLFGFSRGAFTVRAISGLVHLFGLLRAAHENLLPALLRVYRSPASEERKKAANEFRQQFAESYPGIGNAVPIHFIGCWDTVESVGLGQFLGAAITSDPQVKATFRHVRHALALDELRWPFTPRLYQAPADAEDAAEDRSYRQVWFRGAHSDVGGGYRDDAGLSNITWHWLVREACALDLRLEPGALRQHPVQPTALLHSQITASPPWLLAGVFRREVPEDAVIHESVRERDESGDTRPIAWPANAPVCVTQTELPGANGMETVPVPQPPPSTTPPRRQTPASWLLLWLVLSGGLSAVLWSRLTDVDGQWLLRLQLGTSRDSFYRLGEGLASNAEAVIRLLRWDFLFIVAYSVFFLLLMFHLFHAISWRRYPSPALGKTACFSLVALPLADLAENVFTLGALDSRLHAATVTSSAWLFPPLWWETLCSLLTSLAATVKFAALLTLIGVIVVSALAGLRRWR